MQNGLFYFFIFFLLLQESYGALHRPKVEVYDQNIVVILPNEKKPLSVQKSESANKKQTYVTLPDSFPDVECRYWGYEKNKPPLFSVSCDNSDTTSTLIFETVKEAEVLVMPRVKRSLNKRLMTQKDQKRKLIILDPGHGGKDSGARSHDGKTREEDVALLAAMKFKKIFEKKGYDVILTRSFDTFIPLQKRILVPQSTKADLFISIHANASPHNKRCGVEVYTQSEEASDNIAHRLSKKENKALSNIGVTKVADNRTSAILLQLAQRDMKSDSKELAQAFIDKVDFVEAPCHVMHGEADFAVLASLNVPSILVELGYLTNQAEKERLQTSDYRKKLGFALLHAIELYFKNKKNAD